MKVKVLGMDWRVYLVFLGVCPKRTLFLCGSFCEISLASRAGLNLYVACLRCAPHACGKHGDTDRFCACRVLRRDCFACRVLRSEPCFVTGDRTSGASTCCHSCCTGSSVEYIAPSPAMTYVVPSQQLPPAHTITTVTADVNFDIPCLVNPQFSITAVAPQVVGSLPPLQEFDALVYNQIHQEHIVAGETTQNIVENPAVQEQVIVQEIPQVSIVERIQEQIIEPIEVLPHERVTQLTSEQILCTCQSLKSRSRVPSPIW